ncbi:hypothetical protein SANT12839_006920 [Streptomyces antimycoticus]|uniref:Uncharacterized protein n=1 Tax=Streptomyces antimycoticus TaxID=68175 RepID=A0A4D4JYA3_9ACTN|nr:hypothetical protein SANT12839_006920 [Streptomyces antimycoticus]
MFQERPLQRMEFFRGGEPRHALDGGDVAALGGHGEHQAAVDPLPVDQDGAGPALPVVAPLLDPGQRQVFAQGVQQGHPVVEGEGRSAPLTRSVRSL